MTDDLTFAVAALTARVQQLEDQATIRDTIVRYGFAVDSDEADATALLYTDDCIVDVDSGWMQLKGRSGVAEMVRGPHHQAILPNSSHVMGPLVITIDGNSAVAIGYAMLYVRDPVKAIVEIQRQGYGRWELVRRDGRWQIAHRTSLAAGHPDAQALLKLGLE